MLFLLITEVSRTGVLASRASDCRSLLFGASFLRMQGMPYACTTSAYFYGFCILIAVFERESLLYDLRARIFVEAGIRVRWKQLFGSG